MFGAGGVPVSVGGADCTLLERVEVSIVVLLVCVVASVEVGSLNVLEVRLRVKIPVVLGELADVLLDSVDVVAVVAVDVA